MPPDLVVSIAFKTRFLASLNIDSIFHWGSALKIVGFRFATCTSMSRKVWVNSRTKRSIRWVFTVGVKLTMDQNLKVLPIKYFLTPKFQTLTWGTNVASRENEW